MEKFTISFEGTHAKELAEAFVGCFWDGGLDQTIESMFLEQYGLSCDDIEWGDKNHAIIQTDNAKV